MIYRRETNLANRYKNGQSKKCAHSESEQPCFTLMVLYFRTL